MNWGLMAACYAMLHAIHGVGDYWVQTDYQSQFKSKIWRALLTHTITYSILFIPMGIILYRMGEISGIKAILLPIVIAIPHAWMDRRNFINWFARRFRNWKSEDNLTPVAASIRMFVIIEMDQKFHYLCLLFTSIWLAHK